MAMLLLPSATFRPESVSDLRYPYRNPNIPLIIRSHGRQKFKITAGISRERPLDSRPHLLRNLTASAVIFIGVSIRVCSAAASTKIPAVDVFSRERVTEVQSLQDNEDVQESGSAASAEDKELKAAFEKWASKTYALTVPLRVVSLRGSVPPLWIKDFVQSQGRRARLLSESRASLRDIYSDLSSSVNKENCSSKSALAADIVTIGDSWLNFAIRKGLIEPLPGVEDQDWFKSLSYKWKEYLCRNNEGILDPEGRIWAAPYRWGSMVIAYKSTTFKKHNLAPIEDWTDLLRPEFAGKISMVDCPRELVGAVLKCMGASYNTENIDRQVPGGKIAVLRKLEELQKQVRLFDSVHYLKAFTVGDAWVAVGWSSDVLPAAKRMSNVSVIVPKSGTSLWSDLWATPAASRSSSNRIGGRVRGPSPLVHEWIEFCLQPARSTPFRQEVVPGASPFFLDNAPVEEPKELSKGKPKLDTNLVSGLPPAEILARCEFLEPLSDSASQDYKWLINSLQKPRRGLIHRMQHRALSMIQTLMTKVNW